MRRDRLAWRKSSQVEAAPSRAMPAAGMRHRRRTEVLMTPRILLIPPPRLPLPGPPGPAAATDSHHDMRGFSILS